MARIFFIACMLVTCVSAVTALETSPSSPPGPSPSPSPSPPGDCSDVTYNLADCFDFLTMGSNFSKPSSSCCSGFESVVTANVHCVCEAIRSSYDLGLNLNVTRANSVSSLCGISAPLVTTCDIPSPSSSPAPVTPPSPPKESPSPSPLPPKQSPTPSPLNPPARAPSGGKTPAPAPSLAPNTGAAAYSTAAASITVVFLGTMLAAVSLSV